MNDETLAIINAFAKNKERTKEEAERVYLVLAERVNAVEKAQSMTLYAQGAFFYAISDKELWHKMDGVEDWWTFGTFCKEKFKISLSKANELRLLWERSQVVGLTEEEVEQLGWYLASRIARFCDTRADVDKYIRLIEGGMRKGEVLAQLQQDKGIAATPAGTKPFKVQVSETERDLLQESLEIAAQSIGQKLGIGVGKEKCLMLIVAQWREMYHQRIEGESS